MSHQEVLDFGTFYCPAWKHYGRQVNVICDRCKSERLGACIGYGQQDLCMICVHEITQSRSNTNIGFAGNPIVPPQPFHYEPRRQINPYDYFDTYKN